MHWNAVSQNPWSMPLRLGSADIGQAPTRRTRPKKIGWPHGKTGLIARPKRTTGIQRARLPARQLLPSKRRTNGPTASACLRKRAAGCRIGGRRRMSPVIVGSARQRACRRRRYSKTAHPSGRAVPRSGGTVLIGGIADAGNDSTLRGVSYPLNGPLADAEKLRNGLNRVLCGQHQLDVLTLLLR